MSFSVQCPAEDFSCWLALYARFFRSDSRTGHSSLSSFRRIPISFLKDEQDSSSFGRKNVEDEDVSERTSRRVRSFATLFSCPYIQSHQLRDLIISCTSIINAIEKIFPFSSHYLNRLYKKNMHFLFFFLFLFS